VRQPGEQELDVGRPDRVHGRVCGVRRQPRIGHEVDHLGEQVLGDERGEVGVDVPDPCRRPQEDVIARVVRLHAEALRRGPGVVEVQGGPMVDRPELTVPEQQDRVAPGPVDVGNEGIEP